QERLTHGGRGRLPARRGLAEPGRQRQAAPGPAVGVPQAPPDRTAEAREHRRPERPAPRRLGQVPSGPVTPPRTIPPASTASKPLPRPVTARLPLAGPLQQTPPAG